MTSKEFFKVTTLEKVIELARTFPRVSAEVVPLDRSVGRILSQDVISDTDLPAFNRATMDGYAVQARSTFGVSEASPALFKIIGSVEMGKDPEVSVGVGEAVSIPTGGMLPDGADSVVMIEHTQVIDENTIEVFKSSGPMQHVMEIGEDVRRGEIILSEGTRLAPQEIGVLAAIGKAEVPVFRQPVVAIISSGDEIVPVEQIPGPSQLRDVNAHTLSALVRQCGAIPVYLGIAGDVFEELDQYCRRAIDEADAVLISGGSSVGTLDLTLDVIKGLPGAAILVHGVSISPGKPTILATSMKKAVWGLPGQVASAMVVFHVMVRPFLESVAGLRPDKIGAVHEAPAVLSRNLASVQGREDYVRVRLVTLDNQVYAEPVLGKSGLIRTMAKADGLVRIGANSEGLEKGTPVRVILF